MAKTKQLIVCADDFGMDVAVNEAVERAHTHGILICASLMMGMPAVEDAVARAKRLPSLAVGLHITLTAGLSVLPPEHIPGLVDDQRRFEDSMAIAGMKYFFSTSIRRQLREEIRAQFAAFKATGLPLDHVNAHRHFHLHPTLASMLLEIGREFGMQAMRAPYEPVHLLRIAAQGEEVSVPPYLPWVKFLGHRLRRAGMLTNDVIFGLQWTGAMTEKRLLQLIPVLPDGISEIYLHPATSRSDYLVAAMPDYKHVEEFEGLVSAQVRRAIDNAGVELTSYSRIIAERAIGKRRTDSPPLEGGARGGGATQEQAAGLRHAPSPSPSLKGEGGFFHAPDVYRPNDRGSA